MVKERILEVWMAAMDGEASLRRVGIRNYAVTARVEGLCLYTAPATAQASLAPFLPYAEEPGVSWFFEDAEGRIVDLESGRELTGPYVDTFAYFEERYGARLAAAEWLCRPEGEPAAAPTP